MRIPREYRFLGTRYVQEFIHLFYPRTRYIVPYRLVPFPTVAAQVGIAEKDLALHRGYYPEVDGVIWLDGEAIVIEAKLLPRQFIEGWAKLEVYRDYAPLVPEFKQIGLNNIHYLLLIPISSPYIERRCHRSGFECRVWRPDWYDTVLEIYRPGYKEIPLHEQLLDMLYKGTLKLVGEE